jgi:hypothetical protein
MFEHFEYGRWQLPRIIAVAIAMPYFKNVLIDCD